MQESTAFDSGFDHVFVFDRFVGGHAAMTVRM